MPINSSKLIKMTRFLQLLFIAQFIGIAIYTVYVGTHKGWDLASVFFSDLSSLNWAGQFNFDFLNYLVLSGIWIAWRHKFSFTGIISGVIASILGILFFAPYLFFVSINTKGETKKILLGEHYS